MAKGYYVNPNIRQIMASTRRGRKKKRGTVKRGRSYKSPMSVVKGLVPETKMYSLPYVDNQTIDAAIYPDVLSYFYRANDIFDPVYAAGGHQPLYHDQLALFYNHYIVVSSKITVTFTPTATYAHPIACGIYLSDDFTVTTTNITQMLEQQGVKYKYLNANTGDKSVTITKTFSTKKFFNVSNVKDKIKSSLGAAFGFTPEDVAYFATFVASTDYSGATNPPAVHTNIRIDYNVLCSERKELAQS